jgi:hypothetical protein
MDPMWADSSICPVTARGDCPLTATWSRSVLVADSTSTVAGAVTYRHFGMLAG